MLDEIEINIECCKDCKQHNWMVWHDEKWYNKCFTDSKKFIMRIFPNAKIYKNKGIIKPDIGSFEIRH